MDNVIGLNGFRSRNFSQEYLRLNIYGPRKVLVYVSQIMHEYMCVCVSGERGLHSFPNLIAFLSLMAFVFAL